MANTFAEQRRVVQFRTESFHDAVEADQSPDQEDAVTGRLIEFVLEGYFTDGPGLADRIELVRIVRPIGDDGLEQQVDDFHHRRRRLRAIDIAEVDESRGPRAVVPRDDRLRELEARLAHRFRKMAHRSE